MAAGPIKVLGDLTITASEQGTTYSTRATDGACDATGMLAGAVANLREAAAKLTILNAQMPSGSNKTAIAAQLTALTATS